MRKVKIRGKIRRRSETTTTYPMGNVVINGEEIDLDTLTSIVTKWQEEEKKKYTTCHRCKDKFLTNTAVNMCDVGLTPVVPDQSSAVWGYSVTPYISGITINTNCGDGAKIHLCDKCVRELVEWLGRTLPPSSERSSSSGMIITML